jgi:apolipoprotein N-acyltransferase
LYDEYAFWRAGEKSAYQKQKLYLFSDYVPSWMRSLGLARASFDITAGKQSGTVSVSGVAVSGLICSELHNRKLTPGEGRTDLLVAVGDDSFFPGSLVANFSIATAQYYAARYRVPVIRATIVGPSAFIGADGSILASLGYGEKGILRGEIKFPGTKGQE